MCRNNTFVLTISNVLRDENCMTEMKSVPFNGSVFCDEHGRLLNKQTFM